MEIYKNQRIDYIDTVKGFAMFCVLWGHSLQYLRNGYSFLDDKLFGFIYSFHMPLFFMMSGFFFRSSLKLKLKEFLFKKSVQLLLPCIVWALIDYIIHLLNSIFIWDGLFLRNWFAELLTALFPAKWIWFLRELFISFVIVYLSFKLLKERWLACLVSMVFVLSSPLCEVQRVLLPFFWIGIYLKDNYQFVYKYRQSLLILSGITFAVCLLFWNGNYTMYMKSFPKLLNIKTLKFDFTNIDIALFRSVIGLCGSLFWFTLFEYIHTNNKYFACLGKVGTNTLAIYVLQRLVLEKWLNETVDFSDVTVWAYDLVVTPLLSLSVLMICLTVIKVVQKNKYAELILFGKK